MRKGLTSGWRPSACWQRFNSSAGWPDGRRGPAGRRNDLAAIFAGSANLVDRRGLRSANADTRVLEHFPHEISLMFRLILLLSVKIRAFDGSRARQRPELAHLLAKDRAERPGPGRCGHNDFAVSPEDGAQTAQGVI